MVEQQPELVLHLLAYALVTASVSQTTGVKETEQNMKIIVEKQKPDNMWESELNMSIFGQILGGKEAVKLISLRLLSAFATNSPLL